VEGGTSTLSCMTDTITLTGLVATQPRHLVTGEGLPITSFRLASTQRRFDRTQNRWVDGETNWYTITGFRQLAVNIVGSIQKGERVVVTGRLRIRDWIAGEKAGTTIEVDADAIGHDLSWGTSTFVRSISAATIDPAAASLEEAAGEAAGETEAVQSDGAPEAPVDTAATDSVAVPF
jgi:single-strand DNA-binding protein